MGEMMSIKTQFTRKMGVEHPIMLAPMGTVAGGDLTAAVSNAGGLGMLGAGYGDLEWLERELWLVDRKATRPWGVGFITWCLTQEALDLVLSYQPQALMFSFGDLSPWLQQLKQTDIPIFSQIHDLEGAQQASQQGVDFIVAQGTEAGGHGTGRRGTLSLLRGIKIHSISTPIIAAGGIADGAGVAAALRLGADAVSMGTRFYASFEAQAQYRIKKHLIECNGDDTIRTSVFDIIREIDWPIKYSGRAIANRFVARWHTNENALRSYVKRHQADFNAALEYADPKTIMVWAGEGLDVINDIDHAENIVARIIKDVMNPISRQKEMFR